ncbi:MAG: phage tail sheath family protein [Cyanobacteria bacterium SBLK]|nr:phage tail sheath family protein [Cyanobacteria bacterium SBLK]
MARLDYSAPGVYVEEMNRGSRPIEGVNMSVAGFVGFTEDVRGDARLFEPKLITDWNQYVESFGKIDSDGFTDFGAYLPFAVRGWFENGGGRCWVVSIGTQLPTSDNPKPKAIPTRATTAGRRACLEFKFKSASASSQNGALAKADSLASPSREISRDRIQVIVEPDTPDPTQIDDDDEPFDTGEYFKIVIEQNGEILDFKEIPDPEYPGKTKKVTPYRHLSMAKNPSEGTYVVEALEKSAFIEANDISGLAGNAKGSPLSRRPANGSYEVVPPLEVYPTKKLYPKMYGNPKRRTGVQGLFEIDEISTVACPDLMLAYQSRMLTLEQVHGIMEVMITNCEQSTYRMVVLDPPPVKTPIDPETTLAVSPEQSKPEDVAQWLKDWGRRSMFAAIYYPWIKVPNPRANGAGIFVPPCGHMMGVWCNTDETRGVHKAPANVTPRGVVSLAYNTNFREQELLNPKGINCIRKFPDRGIRIWGARTLVEKEMTEWRYISVRRLMSYIERSIQDGTQWAVFEPNDEDLWARVTRTVSNFLERIWRDGALFGSSPEQAFYVKCNEELNPPETMILGRLYVEVGVCPVRPAEFIIFRISQWSPNEDR